ncbi:unnamed protein product [Calypogeia fissa]
MQLSMSVLGAVGREGMMTAQVEARVIGRGLLQQCNRKVYVKMASTALLFSALQPVRPALHIPAVHQQHVGPGRITRGNHSSLLLLRQCASTDRSQGSAAGTVLLETRECADGSIMYKFGSPDQKSVAVDPNSVENEAEGQCQAQLSTEWSDLNVENNECPQLPEDSSVEAVVIVNGVKHSDSASPPSAPEAKAEEVELDSAIIDVNQKLARLELEGLPSGLPVTNGIAPPAEAPVKDVDTPDSKETSEELKSDDTGKEGRPAYLNSGAAMIPHPEKASRGGEDAFFIEGNRWIGVADGVGGWANDGINAGLYARELMLNCAELARDSEEDSDPKSVLIKGFSKTKAQGSTTAVVASIFNQTLNVVNIGDSGFLVIRDGILIDGSTPMIRGFNFPYQIGSEGDDPLLAQVYRVSVKKGDVIILASDGLFDNLFSDEIVAIVNRVVQAGSGPEEVAKKLASEAHKAGARNEGMSPFAQEAQRVGYNYFGGKMDDITAVVSFIY